MKNTQKYFILLLMLILLVPSNIWGQETKKEIIVKGVVEDDLGPIIGASVVAKNQAGVGVITNTEGKFSLKVGPYDVLVVTFVGYQPYELPVLKMNDPNNVTIKLLEDVGKIDEVVITASGYTSSVVPIVIAVACAAWLEKRLKKVIPDVIKTFVVPVVTLAVKIGRAHV